LDPSSITGNGLEFFVYPTRPDRLWGPPSLLSNGHQVLFLRGVKWPGREADHSPPSSTEVKECLTQYLHLQYAFMVWYLVKRRGNFTFTFTFIFTFKKTCGDTVIIPLLTKEGLITVCKRTLPTKFN
jgi:hypothetical protein